MGVSDISSLTPQTLALNSFQLFMNQIAKAGSEPTRIRVLQIVFDILMMHDEHFLKDKENVRRLARLRRFRRSPKMAFFAGG